MVVMSGRTNLVEGGQRRLKRFERDPNAPNVVPTARDDEVFRLLAEFRYLRTSHIQALTGRSKRTLDKRLALLFHNGYLQRIHPGTEIGAKKNAEYIYRLGRRGAKRLPKYREGGSRLPEPIDPNPLFFTHDMLVVDFLIRARLACENSGGKYRFISQDEYLAQASLHEPKRNPLLLDAPTIKNEHTTPDGLCGIEFREIEKEDGYPKMHFFLEADRGTEPGIRRKKESRGRKLSDVQRKYVVYNDYRVYYSKKEHASAREFPFANFKVAFVTISEDRVENLVHKLRDLVPARPNERPGQRGWLFTSKENLFHSDQSFFDHLWLNGQGDRVSILGH